ncbi:MAG TPA: methyltransferase domain-containing protein [Polyangiaceae bacterium]|jgi:SAM-dependent methyltransferase|nr:methyltransferase domain-containing protein [Polyangiaceae bacterium]
MEVGAGSPDQGFATESQEISADARKIRKNALLHCIYLDVYRRLLEEVPRESYPRLLELGSGGGFLKELAPHTLTSECVPIPGIERTVDACRIAEHFEPNSLDAIVAFNVFHHLPDVSGFLRGASSVLRPGGKICLVEPWFTSVGQLFHRLIHHEPYRDDPSDWRLVGEGRMTGANTRLPTSVFRDSDERFQREFPQLVLRKRQPFHKWLYLASGGLKLNTHVPAPIARGLVALDRRVRFGDEALGLFALVVVERI